VRRPSMALEDSFEMVRGNAGPVIGDAELRQRILLPQLDQDSAARWTISNGVVE